MKRLIILFSIVVFILGFSSCEKDDICDGNTPTTPRLIVEFFYTNSDSLLNVTNLKVIGKGMPTGIIFNEAATDSTRYFTSANKIALPLRLSENSTTYFLIQNSNNPALAKTDTLQFNYLQQSVFISRACGYKALFSLNNLEGFSNAFVLNNNPTLSQGNWIKNISVEKYNLETENETHLKIYFSN